MPQPFRLMNFNHSQCSHSQKQARSHELSNIMANPAKAANLAGMKRDVVKAMSPLVLEA